MAHSSSFACDAELTWQLGSELAPGGDGAAQTAVPGEDGYVVFDVVEAAAS